MVSRQVKTTTIRDFGGGWNVSDDENNLNTKFQPKTDNTVRGTDGSISITQGDELFADLTGIVKIDSAPALTPVSVTSGEYRYVIGLAAHGLADGDHVKITGAVDIGGISAAQINRTHGVQVIDANNFAVSTKGLATSTVSTNHTLALVADNHGLGGRQIFGRYFSDELLVFDDIGEIVGINAAGVVTKRWNGAIARALGLEPWHECDRVSAEVIKGTLIAVNGNKNDKPLVYNGTAFNYLVDGASLSNAAIPRSEFVNAVNRYTALANTEYGASRIEFSAKNTTGTYSREPSPAGAVEVDIGMLTQTVDPKITGIGAIRDKMFVAFYDSSMLGTIGVLNGTVHEPDFSDVIALYGSFSHHTIVSLGNDIFCASNQGVISVSLSAQSGTFVPDPISELIRPAYAAHVARLSDFDLRYRTFSVFNSDDRQYMLYLPKYSAISKPLATDPVYMTPSLSATNLFILQAPNHQMEAGDYLTLSGLTDVGQQTAASLNTKVRVRKVINEDQLLIELSSAVASQSIAGGGTAGTLMPVNDEVICYAYTYNPTIKQKRWTRFRDTAFQWATRSQKSSIFVGRDRKIYRLGTISHPIPVRERGDYDIKVWANSTAYTAGQRVQLAKGQVYICLTNHVSAASGTFAEDIVARSGLWLLYAGKPITWSTETPWSDFGDRTSLKEIKRVQFDTRGSAAFTFQIFTDGIYADPLTNELIPLISTEFLGHDAGGFGEADAVFGSGRRTAEEWLWSQPARGKIFKLRFSGTSLHPLTISAVSLSYLKGSTLT